MELAEVQKPWDEDEDPTNSFKFMYYMTYRRHCLPSLLNSRVPSLLVNAWNVWNEFNKEQVEHFSLQFVHFYKEDEDLGVSEASLPHCTCFCLQRSHYFAKQFVVNTRPTRSIRELKNSSTFHSASALAKVREYQRDRIKARVSMSTKQKHEEAMKSNTILNKLLFSAFMPTVSFSV